MMQRALTCIAFLLCFALGALAPAGAQDAIGVGKLTGTLKKIKDTKSVTLGFREASIPFSYLNASRAPIGYSIDLCLAIVDDIRAELGDDTIRVKYVSVDPQSRIPMVADGAVDLECGTTTNNTERQKTVAFSPIIFVSGTKLLAKRSAKLKSYRDLRSRTVVVTEASTNEAAIKAINARERLDITVMLVRDNTQAFNAMDTGKADAWAGDDAVLAAAATEAKRPPRIEHAPSDTCRARRSGWPGRHRRRSRAGWPAGSSAACWRGA